MHDAACESLPSVICALSCALARVRLVLRRLPSPFYGYIILDAAPVGNGM
jgi:hypothetical protein